MQIIDVYQDEEILEQVEEGDWEPRQLDIGTEEWLAQEADEGWMMDGVAGLLGTEEEEARREEEWEERMARRGRVGRAQQV